MHRCAALLAVTVSVASLAGCAHSGVPTAAGPPASALQKLPQRADRADAPHPVPAAPGAYTSPVRIVAGKATGTLFLRGVPGASGTSQLHVTIAHEGYWVNFDQAADLQGHRYTVTQTGDNVSCSPQSCIYYEGVVVSVPETDLARASRSGLVLRISGRTMSYLAQLPATYVADFVHGLAEVAASRSSEGAAPPVPAAPAP